MKTKRIKIIKAFLLILFTFAHCQKNDQNGACCNVDGTGANSLYINGHLYSNLSGVFPLNNAKIYYNPQGSQPMAIQGYTSTSNHILNSSVFTTGSVIITATDENGEYTISIPNTPGNHLFDVTDANGITLGNFSININNDNSYNLAYGIVYGNLSSFASSIPAILNQSPQKAVWAGPYSNLPLDLTPEQNEILQVIHQSVFEKFWKQGVRVGVNTNNKYQRTLAGPDGGTATYLIDYSFADLEQTNPHPSYPKRHTITFNNYQENGMTVNGSYTFNFGYVSSALVSTTCTPGTGVPACPASGWYSTVNDIYVDEAAYNGYEDYKKWYYGNLPGEFCNDVMKPYFIQSNPGFTCNGYIPNKMSANWPVGGTLTVSGKYNQSINVNLSWKNMVSTGNVNDHWNDKLQIGYNVAGRNVILEETTLPGLYKKVFTDAYTSIIALPKDANQTLYQVSGVQGGIASLSVKKEATAAGYTVMETLKFDNYKSSDIILNGEFSYSYKTNPGGGIIEGGTYPGSINISGYYNGSARHHANIWNNGSNFQIDFYFLVDDYPTTFQIATIFLPVSFGN